MESAEASDRFLWDFRKTLADLTAENHYDQLTDLLKARGMAPLHRVARDRPRLHRRRHGGEAQGRRPDERHVDRAGRGRTSSRYDADIRESASVAHIYGQNLVAAESLTAGSGAWSFSPETLKPTADRELSMGLNRFVIHTSVHQPVERQDPRPRPRARSASGSRGTRPGPSRRSRGPRIWPAAPTCCSRAGSWPTSSTTTARTPTSPPCSSGNPPPIPAGYNFDYVNSDVVKNRLTRRPAACSRPRPA